MTLPMDTLKVIARRLGHGTIEYSRGFKWEVVILNETDKSEKFVDVFVKKSEAISAGTRQARRLLVQFKLKR
jgi:hypothetical protein